MVTKNPLDKSYVPQLIERENIALIYKIRSMSLQLVMPCIITEVVMVDMVVVNPTTCAISAYHH
jgi:hypothetical protein